MSGGRRDTSGVDIIEWRPSGHRMTYVAAVARAAIDAGRPVTLWTTNEVTQTVEFQTQVASLVSRAQLSLEISPGLGDASSLLRQLRVVRKRGGGAVVPEADRYLHVLLLALLTRQLPHPTAAIVMRPPQAVAGRLRGRVGSAGKSLLIFALLRSRTVDLQLLEDPLAEGNDRVWSQAILNRESLRLDDPCGLLDMPLGELPSELRQTHGRRFLAVLGVIDDRKQLPLILDAWALADPAGDHDLVVAGKQSPSVVTWLASASLPSNLVLINRYLTDAEIRGVIEKATGIFTLYDGALSSGILVAAASMGRWVIAIEGSRTGSVAARHGFGVVCAPTAAEVAAAAQRVLAKTSMPEPVRVPSSNDFGRHVLRRMIDTQDIDDIR